ncbi:MAG TPA: hypothetical protein VGY99_12795 [Candidatus Binataceae bacterium]|nr:hypothetical protein [Candidatus Binataceae bacterium]
MATIDTVGRHIDSPHIYNLDCVGRGQTNPRFKVVQDAMLDSDYCAGGTQISDRGTGVSATDSEAIEIDRDMVDQYYEAIGTR